ncbi:aminopeptidase [Bacillus sp. SCS-151]|uniref:aminopeptidase n=1 Tax=Nanhaiella sioensis TaxID=3115293 RepID=UPI00397938E5
MANFQRNLEKYAELAVKIGVNIQEKQSLYISASISTVEFVRLVTKKAYEAGAKNVHVEWGDDTITRMKYDLAPDDAFKEFPLWKAQGREEMAEDGAAFLSITSTNPDLLQGVNPDRVAAAQKAQGKALEKFRNYIQSDKVSWTVIAVPSKEWAAKVFPDAKEEEQVGLLWNAIFKATRVDLEDPVQQWQEHDKTLQARVKFLNEKKYKALHYTASNTDLTIELPTNHIWLGGGGKNEDGTYFIANIPTEEVFTMPLKTGVNGYVSSSKPFNYRGNLIENFTLTFENGKIVDCKAEKGEETLKRLIETDEGSHYLGEVALVPHDSPISNSNIIFYNTLFDENASNHLAIGSAYPTCIEAGTTMDKEELEKNGVNTSVLHEDFMVGTADMDIDGLLPDGTKEPLFRNGNWAI